LAIVLCIIRNNPLSKPINGTPKTAPVHFVLRFTAIYGRNFKPKIFTDITMPANLFVTQILARDVRNLGRNIIPEISLSYLFTSENRCSKGITIFKIINDGQIYQAILTIEFPDHFFIAFQPKGDTKFTHSFAKS
jgi:hypothetical protein